MIIPVEVLSVKRLRNAMICGPRSRDVISKRSLIDQLYFSSSKQFHHARTILESIPNPNQEVSSVCLC